jgi:mycothiol synthase
VDEIELRPAAPDDIERLCALHNRSEAHDGVPRILEVAELRDELDEAHVVLGTDCRMAFVGDELAGYIYCHHLPSEIRLERCFLRGEVDPAFRRRGVGRTMIEWGIQRATEQLRSSRNNLPKFIRVDNYDYIEAAHRLYARMGFTPIRWFDMLLRPLTDLPSPVEIDGIDIRRWPDDRDEECRQVKNAAFADHWGSTPTPPDSWESHVRGYGARPDLSFVAVERASDRIVAVCLNHRYESDDELIGRSDGWVDTVGTVAEWRGKGLASALIVASLHAFLDVGLSHASIAVDGDSPTGAGRLYRSLGFEPDQRSIQHQIEVS